jgi:very-short-patch-repair endonuclease
MNFNYNYNNSKVKTRRRVLRRNQTEYEHILWQKLRGRQFEGLKFYRQYSVGKYILDFYCPKLRLAIELDGSGHLKEDAIKYDQRRTAYLASHNIHVVRYYNTDIRQDLEAVMGAIFEEEKKLENNKMK